MTALTSITPLNVAHRLATIRTTHGGGAAPHDAGRGVHFVDLENLLGGFLNADRIRRILASYARVAPVLPGDEVWIGLAPETAVLFAKYVPAEYGVAVGKDGADSADLALSHIADSLDVRRRFTRVCIGSGDGHFIAVAARAAEEGARVTAVTGAGWYNHGLHAVVHERLRLPLWTEPSPAAARTRAA